MGIMTHEGFQGPADDDKHAADQAGPGKLELTDLRLSPGYLLARLGADSRGLWGRMLSERGLTPHHFGVLMALAQLGEAPQQRLVAIIGVDPRNAVGIMDGLSERALLERSIDPNDRRRHVIRLTPAGAAVVAELRAAGTAIEDEMFQGLDPGERGALYALLLKLFDARMRP
jgi:MarR family transcriptional regulator, lower aerobic nicotinate degradation pathway regulator